MRKMSRSLPGAVLWAAFLAGAPSVVSAYTPENHERNVKEGAKMCSIDHATMIGNADIEGMIEGVREPDDPSLESLQIISQRIEPNAYGTRRGVTMVRIAAQSIHGSPNPTRPAYTDAEDDQKQKAIPVPAPNYCRTVLIWTSIRMTRTRECGTRCC